ncbi:hypothetical protein AJ80_05021 [Polytolypa hystricis UAMH7299]|uniref:Ribosomal RNA-processing protein 7 C-terminal domain-containing protein n=1 Tax=Polytolypa hystricis (strain UAMH7299) TaxID=1447883 RepID=A0A2B7Y7D0_POLH7|nr:hypothetical protein AJ80_05021 [Polytolypa hystricis UAMH7299]
MVPKPPLKIADYSVLPLELPPAPSFPEPATHYLYLQPHEPRIPDPDSSRSLFVVDVPINTTETHFRHLFGTQLSAGRVQRVEFHVAPTKKSNLPVPFQGKPSANKSLKRKRVTSEDLQIGLDTVELPRTWDRELQRSGSHAVVVFVDRPSMEASLKAAQKAAKNRVNIVWGDGLKDKLPPLGSRRYLTHGQLRYPSKAELARTANDYMAIFARFEEERTREAARAAEEPDEDGFIKVTRGTKINDVAREEEMKELLAKQKKKSKGLENFYRFQMREKRKERQGELLRKFEEDKKKVEEMKRRRGKVRTVWVLPTKPSMGARAGLLKYQARRYGIQVAIYALSWVVTLFAARP